MCWYGVRTVAPWHCSSLERPPCLSLPPPPPSGLAAPAIPLPLSICFPNRCWCLSSNEHFNAGISLTPLTGKQKA